MTSECGALCVFWQLYFATYFPTDSVNNYKAWMFALKWAHFSTFAQSKVFTAAVKQDLCDMWGKTKPQRLSKTKYSHIFTALRLFLPFRSKQTYFLSVIVSAIWGKSCVAYIRRGWLGIFLRVCRRLCFWYRLRSPSLRALSSEMQRWYQKANMKMSILYPQW